MLSEIFAASLYFCFITLYFSYQSHVVTTRTTTRHVKCNLQVKALA
jgi:hypothetical protein